MAEKIITPIELKVPSEANLRRIISILKGLMAQTSEIAEQCINEFDPEKVYTVGRACFKDDALYIAITTHQGEWDDRHFNLVDGTTVDYFTKVDIEKLFANTSAEMWDYLGGIISDEISTKKTWHSSRIYEELMDIYARSVEYTIKYNARQQKASYKVITREADILDTQFIYLIQDGDGYQMWILAEGGPLNIGNTNIDLSAYYTKEEIDADFLKSADAALTYATIDQIDGIINDEAAATTTAYSSNKVESLLKSSVQTTENKTMKLEYENEKINVSVNDEGIGSLGFIKDGTFTENNTWSAKYINTQLAEITPKNNRVPAGTDLNKYFMNGTNPSTAEIQSWVNVPAAFKITNQGEAMVQWIPYDPNDTYGTQVLTSQAVGAGSVGEWRRCYNKHEDSWTPWKTVIDPLNDDNWVDLKGIITTNSQISELNTYYVKYINGVVHTRISFLWQGPATTATQAKVMTGFPSKYWGAEEFLMSAYSNEKLVSVANCRLDSSGLHIDENNWPTGARIKVVTPYISGNF